MKGSPLKHLIIVSALIIICRVIPADAGNYFVLAEDGLIIPDTGRIVDMPDLKHVENPCRQIKDYITPQHFRQGSMGGFFTNDEVIAELDSLRLYFPDLVSQKIQIGTSIEGRPIWCIKISDHPDSAEAEVQVLFTALHHAMEVASVQQLFFFAWYLLENYSSDAELAYWLDNTEIFLVPVVNPDGLVYNEQTNPNGGGTWRKNRRPNGLFTGVDLNRNYKYAFAYDEIGSSSLGLHPWYRGDSAFSEPETQAMRSLITSQHFSMQLNWHSYGNYLIYPWNYHGELTADSVLFEQFGRYLTMECHYQYGTCSQTYGYNSNGDADDWSYGEITEKNKIISMTAELGSSADGFWPQAANIETLCKRSADLNFRYLRLAGRFALVNDLSPVFVEGLDGYLPLEVYCLGLDTPSSFNVSIAALSPEITLTGPSLDFANMGTLEKRYDSVSYSLSAGLSPGTPLKFLVSVSNGTFTWTDTLTKIYCYCDTLFFDPADDLSQWTASGFDLTTASFVSPPSAFTESPGGNYGMLQSADLETNTAVDLSNVQQAYLRFKARWAVEIGYDYFQVLASVDNGTSWQPLCGKYSSVGTPNQNENEPLYDGFFSDWVNEEISLIGFAGQQLKIRFSFHSNLTRNYDGVYLDDILLVGCLGSGAAEEIRKEPDVMIFPNPASDALTISFSFVPDPEMRITDIYGKRVFIMPEKINERKYKLNTSLFSEACYFLHWRDAERQPRTTKFLVIH